MKEYYKPYEFGRVIGVTPTVLSRWDRTGVLKACRDSRNHKYYTLEQYKMYMDEKVEQYRNYINQRSMTP